MLSLELGQLTALSCAVDINEAQISYPRAGLNLEGTIGSASQSIQVAPMDAGYQWNNGTGGMQIFDPNITYQSRSHCRVGSVYARRA